MQELNKEAMGQRIRQLRLGAKLRQWELAKLLGTTQSAVHKYEHGVVPEPRRLVELARIGGTSIEWVLTGTHWENGSEAQERVSPDLLRTACILREISADGRATVNEALKILREAVRALEQGDGREGGTPEALSDQLPETHHLLELASRIQRAVLRRVTQDADRRLGRSALFAEPAVAGERDGREEPSTADGS
jgi:transcriptional regulator with XRE-family HTH domain